MDSDYKPEYVDYLFGSLLKIAHQYVLKFLRENVLQQESRRKDTAAIQKFARCVLKVLPRFDSQLSGEQVDCLETFL